MKIADRVRLVDIAAQVNVSRAVVGRVLLGSGSTSIGVSEEKAKLIKTVAGRMGYQPNRIAQQLRGARSKFIGILSQATPSQVLQERLNCLDVETDKHGYRIIIGHIAQDENNLIPYMNDFISRGCEGFVLLKQLTETDEKIHSFLRNLSVPVLCFENTFPDIPSFSIDRADGIRLTINHLLEKNYHRIGIVLTTKKISTMIQRLKGYENAIVEGISGVADELIYSAELEHTPHAEAPEWKNMAKQVVNQLVLNHKADAIIAPNDVWACHLMRELQSRGLSVPQDVGVVGFDNSQAAMIFSPSITSIDQNSREVACQVMNYFINFTHGETLNRNMRFIIKPKLVIRESTSKI